MLKSLDDEKIVLEIKGLIVEIDKINEEVNIYCDLVKQMFLRGSKEN